ncbi:MAG: hypothetical protein HQ498_07395 [Pseudohongiella sp.]|nr:hypothetical protein [Pseudohongiella sp.]
MKQQINLYLAEFKLKKEILTALLMAQILGGVIVLIILSFTYEFTTSALLNAELAELQLTLQQETSKTNELVGVLARRTQDTELIDRLDRDERRLDSGRRIRDFLRATKLGNLAGFSEHLKDLSRASMDGLSLSEFTITEGGDRLSLVGQVIDSSLVPRYVSNLARSNSTIRNQFFGTTISLQGQNYSFALRTSND